MSGKRPASASDATEGPRQFKQTKLNFFTSAPKKQPQKPKVPLQEEEMADQQQEQPADQDGPSRTTVQPPNTTTTLDSPLESSPSASPASPAPTPTTTHPTNPIRTTTTTTATPAIPTMSPARLRITDRTGDLFTAPTNTLLIHACNTIGSWGGGIALAFRNLYPAEFRVYRAHCARSTPNQLVGTALLIAPQRALGSGGGGGGGSGSGSGSGGGAGGGGGHYIGCLFTSRRFGAARDPPDSILRATVPAMRHLMRLVVEEEARTGVRIGEVRMCRINAGLFAVPWESSKQALEAMELGEGEVPGCAEGGVVDVVAWERA
ncbi:hypothetical protein F5144DRAFT_401471 [Chaetomium tenue]|uniref:Uncharacterized protein n=1 Tax=Chaetomium tenue TaxID=1854479 RepID=A0ACB7NX16_9PEZI|nr:hypothetical protein F5144DRAFT_401471 [Chaetomium globosum]